MQVICLHWGLFRNERALKRSEWVLNNLLRMQLRLNRDYIRQNRPPPLYKSGVYYQVEPRGQENWNIIPVVMKNGQGDCEDLASWRLAELQEQGETDARYVVKRSVRPSGFILYHIMIRRGARGGHKLEDPSRRLGMGR